jgi:tetratricopeptide (TPR) repeat protein
MTPVVCNTHCGKGNFIYFGVQYGTECWCGNAYGKYAKLGDERCGEKCGGDIFTNCGGRLTNSVYEVDAATIGDGNSAELVSKAMAKTANRGTVVAPEGVVEAQRPLMALVMMLKNEAHTLPDTLTGLGEYFDYYYILDTGSTDGTQQMVVDLLGGNGELHEEPFVDYGTTRNRVMDIATVAAKTKLPPVFLFMMSADETLVEPAKLRAFAEAHRHSVGSMHEAYPLVMNVGWSFDSLRLSRTDARWRYVGKVHEYLAAPDGKGRQSIRIPDVSIKFTVTDPERRGDREKMIARILEKELEADPSDGRSSFYLARTYNVLRNHTASLAQFQNRVRIGGWPEEVYESMYAIGWQRAALDQDWPVVQQAFLDAHAFAPDRAEPLHAIADHYARKKNWPLAFVFALQASRLVYPKHAALWVQADVYKWKCHYVLGMAAEAIGEYQVGARALVEVLKQKPTNRHVRKMLMAYKERLTVKEWQSITNLNKLKKLRDKLVRDAENARRAAAGEPPLGADEPLPAENEGGASGDSSGEAARDAAAMEAAAAAAPSPGGGAVENPSSDASIQRATGHVTPPAGDVAAASPQLAASTDAADDAAAAADADADAGANRDVLARDGDLLDLPHDEYTFATMAGVVLISFFFSVGFLTIAYGAYTYYKTSMKTKKRRSDKAR